MGHIQKIILLVVIVPLALFPGGVISYVLLFENLAFETTMWIPVGMTILGICSLVFHFKTRNFYRLLKQQAILPKVEPLFWVLNISYGVVYIVMSLYLIYLLNQLDTWKEYAVVLVFVIPLLIMGIWTLLEAYYLNRLIHVHNFANRHSEIDDIKGDAM
ncbi:hypothetical protein BXY82_1366 [Gelidibacter sediminis]|uniref:Uncharacterized protein n=1 Tax=Gelidibacter sediminis TaxID=1608710 RepID=A0A4R7Q8P4_9FLAO|nr:hypothetical protein [Gelidibacter sediminis]TDU43944.1 hypothetical protein BXY82_1366 [Gelidibacter sediminis]